MLQRFSLGREPLLEDCINRSEYYDSYLHLDNSLSNLCFFSFYRDDNEMAEKEVGALLELPNEHSQSNELLQLKQSLV